MKLIGYKIVLTLLLFLYLHQSLGCFFLQLQKVDFWFVTQWVLLNYP